MVAGDTFFQVEVWSLILRKAFEVAGECVRGDFKKVCVSVEWYEHL